MMDDIYSQISKIAQEKKVDTLSLYSQGYSPEQVLQYLQEAPEAPLTGVSGLFKGLGRGLVSGTVGTYAGIGDFVEALGGKLPLKEEAERIVQEHALPPESDLLSKIGYVGGNVLSFLLPTLPLKAAGVAGKLYTTSRAAPYLTELSQLAAPVAKYGIPVSIGMSTAGQAYKEQPEEDKDLARATLGGAIAGAALAIPMHRWATKLLGGPKPLTEETVATLAKEGVERLPGFLKSAGREALIGATTFPAVTTVMDIGHQIGAKGTVSPEELIRSKFEMGLPEAIVGAVMGAIPGGIYGARYKTMATEAVEKYLQTQLQRAKEPDVPQDMRRQLLESIVSYLRDKSEVIDTAQYDGESFVRLNHLDALRPFYDEAVIDNRFAVIKTPTPDGRIEFILHDLKTDTYEVIEGSGITIYNEILRRLGKLPTETSVTVETKEPVVEKPVEPIRFAPAEEAIDRLYREAMTAHREATPEGQYTLFKEAYLDKLGEATALPVMELPERRVTPATESILRLQDQILSEKSQEQLALSPEFETLRRVAYGGEVPPPERLKAPSISPEELYRSAIATAFTGKAEPLPDYVKRLTEREIPPAPVKEPEMMTDVTKFPKTAQTMLAKADVLSLIGTPSKDGTSTFSGIGAIREGKKTVYYVIKETPEGKIPERIGTIKETIDYILENFPKKVVKEKIPKTKETGKYYTLDEISASMVETIKRTFKLKDPYQIKQMIRMALHEFYPEMDTTTVEKFTKHIYERASASEPPKATKKLSDDMAFLQRLVEFYVQKKREPKAEELEELIKKVKLTEKDKKLFKDFVDKLGIKEEKSTIKKEKPATVEFDIENLSIDELKTTISKINTLLSSKDVPKEEKERLKDLLEKLNTVLAEKSKEEKPDIKKEKSATVEFNIENLSIDELKTAISQIETLLGSKGVPKKEKEKLKNLLEKLNTALAEKSSEEEIKPKKEKLTGVKGASPIETNVIGGVDKKGNELINVFVDKEGQHFAVVRTASGNYREISLGDATAAQNFVKSFRTLTPEEVNNYLEKLATIPIQEFKYTPSTTVQKEKLVNALLSSAENKVKNNIKLALAEKLEYLFSKTDWQYEGAEAKKEYIPGLSLEITKSRDPFLAYVFGPYSKDFGRLIYTIADNYVKKLHIAEDIPADIINGLSKLYFIAKHNPDMLVQLNKDTLIKFLSRVVDFKDISFMLPKEIVELTARDYEGRDIASDIVTAINKRSIKLVGFIGELDTVNKEYPKVFGEKQQRELKDLEMRKADLISNAKFIKDLYEYMDGMYSIITNTRTKQTVLERYQGGVMSKAEFDMRMRDINEVYDALEVPRDITAEQAKQIYAERVTDYIQANASLNKTTIISELLKKTYGRPFSAETILSIGLDGVGTIRRSIIEEIRNISSDIKALQEKRDAPAMLQLKIDMSKALLKDLVIETLQDINVLKRLKTLGELKDVKESKLTPYIKDVNKAKELYAKSRKQGATIEKFTFMDIVRFLDNEKILEYDTVKEAIDTQLKGFVAKEKASADTIRFVELMNVASKIPVTLFNEKFIRNIVSQVGLAQKYSYSEAYSAGVSRYVTQNPATKTKSINTSVLIDDLTRASDYFAKKLIRDSFSDIDPLMYAAAKTFKLEDRTVTLKEIAEDNIVKIPILARLADVFKELYRSDKYVYDILTEINKYLNNPIQNLKPTIFFIPKDYASLAQAATTQKANAIQGYVAISIPKLSKLSEMVSNLINAIAQAKSKPQLNMIKELFKSDILVRDSSLQSALRITDSYLIFLDANTYLKTGFAEALRKTDKIPTKDIIYTYIKGITGTRKFEETATPLYDAVDKVRLDSKTWQDVFGSKNIFDVYSDYIIDKYVDTKVFLQKAAEMFPKELKEIKRLLDTAELSSNTEEVRKAKIELGQLLSGAVLNKTYEESINAFISKIIDKAIAKKPHVEFRSIIDDISKEPTKLKDPINFISFMKEVTARAIGEADILLTGDASDLVSFLEYKYGTKFTGFAIKMANRDILGIVYKEHLTTDTVKTFGHELLHLAWDNISSIDKKLLLSKFKHTENIAESFGNYMLGKYEPPSFAKRVFDYLSKIWERIINILRGAGFVSSQDIFDKIYAGEYAKKSPSEVPLANFIDAWDFARMYPNYKEIDWNIAFERKVKEAEKQSNVLINKLADVYDAAKRYVVGAKGLEGYPQSITYGNVLSEFFRKGKDLLMTPIRHNVLVSIVDSYKYGQRYIHDKVITKAETLRDQLKILSREFSPEEYAALERFMFKSDDLGRFATDFKRIFKENFPNISEEKLEKMWKVYNSHKAFTDSVFIETNKQVFNYVTNLLKSTIAYDAYKGKLSSEQSLEFTKQVNLLIQKITSDLYRLYDYEIVESRDKDGNIVLLRKVKGQDLRDNYSLHLKDFTDAVMNILKDPELQETYNKLITKTNKEGFTVYQPDVAIDAVTKEAIGNKKEIDTYLSMVSAITKYVKRTYDLLKELDNGFYIARQRNNGNYEAMVLYRVPILDENGNPTGKFYFTTVEYRDSYKEHTDIRQREFIRRTIDELKEKYRIDNDGKDIVVIDTAPIYTGNFDIAEYVLERYGDNNVVIIAGRKAPKSKAVIYEHNPSELLHFLANLATRVDKENFKDDVKKHLQTALTEMYADVSFAMARKLQRKRLPTYLVERLDTKAVAGYKQNLLEVLDEYIIRMQGHMSNKVFLSQLIDITNTPEFRELAITNPDLKSIIDKQIDLIMSPNTKLGDFIYKFRALTAFMYLGGRLSSALLNYMNFPTVFMPEYVDIKSASSFTDIQRRVMYGLETTMRGLRQGTSIFGDVQRSGIDALKKYPEAMKDFKDAFSDFNKYVKWKVKDVDVFGNEREVRLLDPIAMQVNVEPLVKMYREATAKGDTKKALQLAQDIYILKGIKELIADQTIESSFYHMLRQEGMHLFGKTLRTVLDASFIPFRMAERHIRTVSAIMLFKELFNRASDNGKNIQKGLASLSEAVNITSRIIDSTYFRYDRLNRYWWTNPNRGIGAVLTLPTTLRGFTTNFLSTYFNWFERKHWDKIAMSIAPLLVLGGVAALPAVDDILTAMENITGSPIKLKTYKMTKDLFGEDLAQAIIKGVPSFFVDLSASLKAELPLIPKSLDFEGFNDMVFGIHKDLFKRVVEKGIPTLLEGEWLAAMTYLAPLGLALPAQAVTLSTRGLETKYGRQISDIETGQPFTLTTDEAVIRALGFRPARLAEIQDLRYYGTKINKRFEKWRTEIYKQYRHATDDADMKQVMDDIVEFNKAILDYKGAISPITPQSLRRAIMPKKDEALLISKNLLAS